MGGTGRERIYFESARWFSEVGRWGREVLVHRPKDLTLALGHTRWQERSNSQMSSSDLHTCIMALHRHTHTLTNAHTLECGETWDDTLQQ